MKICRAIKRIPKDAALTASFSLKADFPAEALLLMNLNHPGIPLIYDIDEDADYIYMIEEYIQGESLDTFVSHQNTISLDLVYKISLQLCDILDYLHHLTPYPILYQDLKPEHIILCGNQVKLIDFGIASFFTGPGNHFQKYGTDGFAAPEALAGLPVGPSADIYGLGRVLEFLAASAEPACPDRFSRIIARASCDDPSLRYGTAADVKAALLDVQHQSGRASSHLIRSIAVIGSSPGAGATHLAVTVTGGLNKKGISSLYMPCDGTDTLGAAAQINRSLKEQDGVFYYGHFKGMPVYGNGITLPAPSGHCIIKDYGSRPAPFAELESSDVVICVLNGADWAIPDAVSLGKQLALLPQTVFVCSHGNRKAARIFARHLGRRVFCFPADPEPYRITGEKLRLILAITQKKGGD